MAKVYFVRHQAAGVLWDSPFGATPSAGQVGALKERCEQRHGDSHPKSGEPYWLTIEEIQVLGDADMPDVSQSDGGVSSSASAGEFVASGTGVVIPKEV